MQHAPLSDGRRCDAARRRRSQTECSQRLDTEDVPQLRSALAAPPLVGPAGAAVCAASPFARARAQTHMPHSAHLNACRERVPRIHRLQKFAEDLEQADIATPAPDVAQLRGRLALRRIRQPGLETPRTPQGPLRTPQGSMIHLVDPSDSAVTYRMPAGVTPARPPPAE